MKKVGLALGGGGARGLCHIEFIKALDEMNIKPSIISGTSIGSIVGAFYAGGLSGMEMEALLESLGLIEITKMVDLSIFSITSMVKGKGVEEFLSQHLPVKNFEGLFIPMKVVATDFWRQKEVVFSSGDLCKAIRASLSVPALFEPTKIDDLVLVDGGIVNPVPYDIIRKECDVLIAIDVTGTHKIPQKVRVPNMFENVLSTIQILQVSIIQSKMEINQPDIYIKPELKNIGLLDFEKTHRISDSVKPDVEKFKEILSKY